MNPLMYGGLLPDSARVSRDAAERHAALAARQNRARKSHPHLRLPAWRVAPQS